MRNLVPVLALASTALLAACAYPSPQHVQALDALIGKSETDLVRARGVPTKTYETGGLKFLAYDMHRIDSLPGDAGFYPGFGYGGLAMGASVMAHSAAALADSGRRSCSATAARPSSSKAAASSAGACAATIARDQESALSHQKRSV